MDQSPAEFSETYPEARRKFLEAAQRAGGVVTSYRHDQETGPSGETLHLDVARLGRSDATRVLVVGCGTHGVEGYSGSALQTHWMAEQGTRALPADFGVLLFHAHNPWGFAHALRFTEENVDLNRNFVDFTKPLPPNPGYCQVHEIIAFDEWSEARVATAFVELASFREQVGEQMFSDAFNGGQYSHEDGIFYGGVRAQWSNRAFRHAVLDHLPGVQTATLIDLHTGIGPAGGHVFLCFHPAGSAAHDRVRRWWGERAVNRDGVTHKALAKYQGLLVDAFVEMQAGVNTTAVVVEFGTLPRDKMQRASIAASWLCTHRDATAHLRSALMQDIRDAFYPSDLIWRRGVLAQGKDIIDRAVAGMAAEWPGAELVIRSTS